MPLNGIFGFSLFLKFIVR